MYLHKGCYGSIVSSSTISSITLNAETAVAYYPSAGFTAFTDTVSQSKGDASYCPKSYTVTISPAGILTTFIFDEPNRRF